LSSGRAGGVRGYPISFWRRVGAHFIEEGMGARSLGKKKREDKMVGFEHSD